MADIQLDEYQEQTVNREVERQLKDDQVETVSLDKLKTRTTKQLTQDLAMFNYRLRQIEDYLKSLNEKLENIDAAAYMAATSLERKGSLHAIKEMNRKLQIKVAKKIGETRTTIDAYNDDLIAKMKEEVEKRKEEAKNAKEDQTA